MNTVILTSTRTPWLISNLMHKILIYLHIIHLLESSTCFEHCPAHVQEVYVVIVYMQPLVSPLSAGDCLVHRLRKTSFLTGAQDSHLQRMTIPDAAYTGCPRRKGPNFGRVFLRSNYTDITQNTYIQSSMVTEIMAREKCGLLWCLRTVLCP